MVDTLDSFAGVQDKPQRGIFKHKTPNYLRKKRTKTNRAKHTLYTKRQR